MVSKTGRMVLTMTSRFYAWMAIKGELNRGTLEQLIVTSVDAENLEPLIGKIILYPCWSHVQWLLLYWWAFFVWSAGTRQSRPFVSLTSLYYCFSCHGCTYLGLGQNADVGHACRSLLFCPAFCFLVLCFRERRCRRSLVPGLFIAGDFLFADHARWMVLKGIGIGMLWRQVFALALFIAIVLTISIKKFNKKIA